MDNYVAGKVIVVTGAAGGFGRLVCEKTAALGAKIVAADVNETELKITVNNVTGAGAEAIAQVTDVTDRHQMISLADAAINKFGRIDVIINNAGVMPLAFHADHKIAAEAWDRCIDINFKGVVHGISAVHDHMIAQGRGHVVNISSIYGNYPVAGGGVYGATKAAVVFLSESLRAESQGKIKVTTIRPTGVPETGLSTSIVNPAAITGLIGANTESWMSKVEAVAAGQSPKEMVDRNAIEYFSLDASTLADQIVYVINQPWGVVISDITIRSAGESYVI